MVVHSVAYMKAERDRPIVSFFALTPMNLDVLRSFFYVPRRKQRKTMGIHALMARVAVRGRGSSWKFGLVGALGFGLVTVVICLFVNAQPDPLTYEFAHTIP